MGCILYTLYIHMSSNNTSQSKVKDGLHTVHTRDRILYMMTVMPCSSKLKKRQKHCHGQVTFEFNVIYRRYLPKL